MAIRLAKDALATPDLRRLQLGWAAAAVGGWSFMVALAIHAYAVGGAAAVGLAALVRMVPAGLAAPLAGHLADRFPRRDVLVASTAGRALLLGLAALCVSADAPFAVLLVLATLFTVVATAHKPAQAALLPHLAPDPARQAAANALWSGIDNGAFVVGALAAGLITAALGAEAAFTTAALAFAAATLLLTRIEHNLKGRANSFAGPGIDGPGRLRTAAATLERSAPFGLGVFEGMAAVAREPRLRVLVGVLSASTLVEGMVDVLVVVVALRLVGLGDAGVGWLNAAWGVGGIVGGAVALALVGRRRLDAALPAGLLLVGLPLIGLALVPVAGAALIGLGILGVGYSLVEVAGLTLLQRLARDEVRARAFAVVESAYWLTTGLGAMLAPLVVSVAGPRGALVVVGAALPLILLARWAALMRLAPATAATAARRVAV